jgi:hypothetical protein
MCSVFDLEKGFCSNIICEIGGMEIIASFADETFATLLAND